MVELPAELTAPADNAACIHELLEELQDEIVIWVGAGLSAQLGYPTWAQFLVKQAEEAGAEAEVAALLQQGLYEEAAELLLERRKHRAFHDAIGRLFNEARISGSPVGGAIAYVPRLTNGLIVTTNFDRVLEQVCFEQLGEPLERIMGSEEQRATEAVQKGQRVILKLHGDIKERSDRVLTKDDYERAYGAAIDENTGNPRRLVKLLDLIFAKRVLFLGASLQADRTVSALRPIAKRNEDLAYYAVVECPVDRERRNERAADLSDLGVRPIWYPEGRHELVETLLAYLVAAREEAEASPDEAAVQLPLVQDGDEWLHVEPTDDAPREIIEARLTALDGSLGRPDDPSEWPERLDLETQVVPPLLWGRLTEQIDNERKGQRSELDRIAKQLAAAGGGNRGLGALWGEYSKLNSESRRLFRDFLELLGGLAVRGKLGDERLLRVADELIKECAEDMWKRESSVAIPAIEEALARTPAGIVRLRFPEWTIWNLALVAHEYGHVVMYRQVAEPLREATEKRAKRLLRTKQTAERDRRRARRQLQVLLADAFAAYVLGPAYGCAAIILKLDPSAEADWNSPADAERAYVIFATLKKLEGFEKSASYREVVAFLEDRWAQLVKRVEPTAALRKAEIGALDEFVRKLHDTFEQDRDLLRSSAPYPYHFGGPTKWDSGEGGWQIAETWARGWLAALGNAHPPALEIPKRSRVRDVLNAAWICRIAEPTKIAAIEELAEDACLQLVPKREDEAGEGTGTPSRPPARGVPARLTP